MIKLYFKTLAMVVFLTYFILSAYQFGFSYFTKENFNNINQLMSKGTFSYLQTLLSKTPQSQWESTLQKLQPSNEPLAKIIPIQSLSLNQKDKQQIINGNMVFTYGKKFHFIYFLYYGFFESFAIQRINNSDFALEIMLTEPINHTIKDTTSWMAQIIFHELNHIPQNHWQLKLNQLQKTFDVPLKLISINSDTITNTMQQDLSTYGVAYLKPERKKPISTIYFKTNDQKQLLVIGPIQYSPLSSLFSVAQRYYFMTFSLASILIVIFLTWLFSRNVLKIYQLTQKYSKGNFDANIKISRTSILQGIYQNIIAMGNSLKRLMQSQQNMTRFIAHEVRTPLSTMQLALDSLKKENNLSEKSQHNLISIQEDIHAINQLISYFLLYYKTTSHELKCKMEFLNISDWLEAIVKKYELSKIKITFISAGHNINCRFDPQLLKNVVDNLITNALKFAKNNVIVSVNTDKNNISIHAEDDGPGIPQSEINNIFEPFNVLNENQEFGKHIGLGLTIAKSIVALHKGSIVVSQSEKLGGAKLSIIFPI